MNDWYAKRFAIGLAAEKMYEKYLSRLWSCRKPTPQNPTEPYDYECIHDIWGHRKTVEIKNYGSPKLGTIFAETLQVKSNTVPEYLLYPHLIDEMVYVDQINKRAFIYDMKKFASYVKDISNKFGVITIDAGTAKGITFKEDTKDAGYIETINI